MGAPPRSAKLERFERLAERRVTEALRALRLIGNLANRHNYEYTDEHFRQIVEALDAGMKQVKHRFRQGDPTSGNAFSFRK